MDTPASSASSLSCRHCGTAVHGRFCSSCGERVLTDDDRRIRSLLRESLEQILNFDSTLLRTLRTLLFHPGKLTTEYWEGRRIAYMRPLQLLLVLNLFYFFAAYCSAQLGFHVRVMFPSLDDLLRDRFFSHWAEAVVRSRITAAQTDYPSYRILFDAQLESAAKSLVVFIAPIVAFFLWLFHLRPRRAPLYHLIGGIHLLSFYIFFWSTSLIVLGLLHRFTGITDIRWFGYLSAFTLVAYIFLALRRLYPRPLLLSAATALIFVFVLITAITNLYDLLLFVAVLVMQ